MTNTLSDIFQLVQEAQHGGSGKGMSYYTKAAANGRQVRLEEEARAEAAGAAPVEAEVREPGDKLSATGIGVAYHLLQEHGAGLSEHVWDARESAYTPEFIEALRLYRAYQQKFGSVQARWGFSKFEAEVALPSTPEAAAAALALFGGEVTGRLDGVGYIGPEEIGRVRAETGLPLPAPGWYLLDHKTASKESANDVWTYEHGLQACNYILLWDLQYPDRPCQGMIFDQIIRTKVIKHKAYFASALGAEPRRIQNIVKIAKHNIENDVCVPSGCSSFFGPCYWRKIGKCQGF